MSDEKELLKQKMLAEGISEGTVEAVIRSRFAIKNCKTCVYRSGLDPEYYRCGKYGFYAEFARRWEDKCGPEGKGWTEKPKRRSLRQLFFDLFWRLDK